MVECKKPVCKFLCAIGLICVLLVGVMCSIPRSAQAAPAKRALLVYCGQYSGNFGNLSPVTMNDALLMAAALKNYDVQAEVVEATSLLSLQKAMASCYACEH